MRFTMKSVTFIDILIRRRPFSAEINIENFYLNKMKKMYIKYIKCI